MADKSSLDKKFPTVFLFGMVAVIALLIASGYNVLKIKRITTNHTQTKEKLTLTLTELDKGKKAYISAQKMLEDNGIKNNINPKVIEWAYKNAKSYIPKTYLVMFLQEAKKYKNYLMIVAIIKEESGFDPFARSTAGAKGLGQIRTKIPENSKSVWLDTLIDAGIWQEEIDVYDYRKNIAAVDYILKEYKLQYGSWRNVLFNYVNGNDKYVTKVLSNYAELSLMIQENNQGEVLDAKQEIKD